MQHTQQGGRKIYWNFYLFGLIFIVSNSAIAMHWDMCVVGKSQKFQMLSSKAERFSLLLRFVVRINLLKWMCACVCVFLCVCILYNVYCICQKLYTRTEIKIEKKKKNNTDMSVTVYGDISISLNGMVMLCTVVVYTQPLRLMNEWISVRNI